MIGKRQFKVAHPDGGAIEFSLDAQVSVVYLCHECFYVVAVFFPYRAAGLGEYAVLDYLEDGVVITEEYLKDFLGDRMHECARCSRVYVQAEAVAQPI